MSARIVSFFIASLILFGHVNVKAEQSVNTQKTSISSEYVISHGHPYLPIMIRVEPGRELYQDPIWSIKIIQILADGKPVVGKPSSILLDYLNVESIISKSDYFIYAVKVNNMIFGMFTSEADYSLVEYSIPNDASSIVIKYNFVYYDGKVDSRVHTLSVSRAG